MDYKDLTEEQRAKLANASTAEDILKIAKEEGIELSDKDLEQMSGGWEDKGGCKKCGGMITYNRALGCYLCERCGEVQQP